MQAHFFVTDEVFWPMRGVRPRFLNKFLYAFLLEKTNFKVISSKFAFYSTR